MTNISNPIVFFGTDKFSLTAFQTLIESGIKISSVVTKPDSTRGRGMIIESSELKKYAESYDIPVFQPHDLLELKPYISSLRRPIGVLVSYGKILPQEILDAFTPGIINLHPSLLPKLRGPSPIETSIMNQDTTTGVSVMLLNSTMDAGPIYDHVVIDLTGKETAGELYGLLAKEGSHLLVRLLPLIIEGSVAPVPQDSEQATYCKIIKKSDGIIDWKLPAETIEAKIRALHEWPQSRTTLNNVDVIVTRAEVLENYHASPGSLTVHNKSDLVVGTARGGIRILGLKPVGKNEMTTKEFLAGYSKKLEN
jgi:methionyl-tRNA formyltransferase